MNKLFIIILSLIIAFSAAGFVLAALNDNCCRDTGADDCGTGEKCYCEPSTDCDLNDIDKKVTAGKAGTCAASGAVVLCSPTKYTKIEDLIESVGNWIFFLGLAIVPLMVVIAGAMILSSAGNPETVTTGKNMLIWTMVGVGVIFISKSLYAIIKMALGVT